jgi:hypothetical protein
VPQPSSTRAKPSTVAAHRASRTLLPVILVKFFAKILRSIGKAKAAGQALPAPLAIGEFEIN